MLTPNQIIYLMKYAELKMEAEELTLLANKMNKLRLDIENTPYGKSTLRESRQLRLDVMGEQYAEKMSNFCLKVLDHL